MTRKTLDRMGVTMLHEEFLDHASSAGAQPSRLLLRAASDFGNFADSLKEMSAHN